jgi:hypothetical protein
MGEEVVVVVLWLAALACCSMAGLEQISEVSQQRSMRERALRSTVSSGPRNPPASVLLLLS